MGLMRIAGRVNGIKIYQRAIVTHEPLDPEERLRRLVLLIASILTPLPESSLRAAVQHLRYSAPDLAGRKGAVASLLKSGALESAVADGVRYVWPSGRLKATGRYQRVERIALSNNCRSNSLQMIAYGLLIPATPPAICSTRCAREGAGSNRSAKYCVSWATSPSRNSMMLTVSDGMPS